LRQHQQHNQITAEVWVAVFTAILAFSTIGLWFVTWIAANAALRQVRQRLTAALTYRL